MKLIDNATALAGTMLEMLESRIELATLEYKLEKKRVALLIGAVILACGSFLFTAVAFFVFLAFVLPPEYRAVVLGACAAFMALLFTFSLAIIWRLFNQSEKPFAGTREELGKDIECLSSVIKKKK